MTTTAAATDREVGGRLGIPARRFAVPRRPAAVLAALQVAAILTAGAVTVVRFHVFAAVDERADVAYVQEVAEQHRLPWLGRDDVSWQVEAIDRHAYPRHAAVDPRRLGLGGLSYEAFQPPLYYVLAAPAFLLVRDYRHKVIAVRAFDLALLAVALALIALLARAVFAEAWLGPYCLALAVLLWPGVIVRAVTVSNAPLEFPVVTLYLLVLWHATARRSGGLLVGAGAVLGLCVLTKLTWVCLAPLLLIPMAGLWRGRRDRRTPAAIVAAPLLALALVAPWLASNESRYGALTPSALAKTTQQSYVNPTDRHYGLAGLESKLSVLVRGVLPQEWWSLYDKPVLGLALRLVGLLLVAVAIGAIIRRPRSALSPAAGVLAVPLPLSLVTLAGIVLLANWPSFLPRYAYATLAPFALFTAWAWRAAGWRARGPLWLAGSLTVAALLTWAYVAGAFYFTDVGAALGIHATAV